MKLAFKYNDRYFPVLTIARQQASIVIVQHMFLPIQQKLELTDMHYTYPSDGRLHMTVEKADMFRGDISRRGINIQPKIAGQDLSLLEVALLPFQLFTGQALPLAEIIGEKVINLPTIAIPLERTAINQISTPDRPSSRYHIIDLSSEEIGESPQQQNGVVNIISRLKGSASPTDIPILGRTLYTDIEVGKPAIEIVVTAPA